MTVSVKAPTSTTGSIQLNGSDVLTIESDRSVDIDSNTLHVDATNNRVGIGTASPSHNLQVYSASNPEMRLGDATVTYQLYTDGSTAAVTGTVGNHALVYRTNATERMRIDSSGYVTEPNKPMAFAINAPDTGTSPGSPVVLKYATATYNPGSHYNATTGLFTCPVAGRYKVTQHCMVNAGLTVYALSVSINKNGGGVTTGYTSNTTYNINTCMAIISCAANDTLSATLNHGGKHAGYDSFTVEFLG